MCFRQSIQGDPDSRNGSARCLAAGGVEATDFLKGFGGAAGAVAMADFFARFGSTGGGDPAVFLAHATADTTLNHHS